MPAKNFPLNFRSLKDEKPADNMEVFYVETSPFYSTYEIRVGRIEYRWEELDEDGDPTGCCYFTDEDDPAPEGCRLDICVKGDSLPETTLWVPAVEMDELLVKAEKA